MNDSGAVRFFKCTRDLDRDVEYFGNFQRRRCHLPAQRHAVDELGGDVMVSVVNSDFVNRENVWMVEIRRGRRFLFEAIESIPVGSEFVTEDLDRDLATELHVFSKIDDAHPACAELLKNLVMRDLFGIHLKPQKGTKGLKALVLILLRLRC